MLRNRKIASRIGSIYATWCARSYPGLGTFEYWFTSSSRADGGGGGAPGRGHVTGRRRQTLACPRTLSHACSPLSGYFSHKSSARRRLQPLAAGSGRPWAIPATHVSISLWVLLYWHCWVYFLSEALKKGTTLILMNRVVTGLNEFILSFIHRRDNEPPVLRYTGPYSWPFSVPHTYCMVARPLVTTGGLLAVRNGGSKERGSRGELVTSPESSFRRRIRSSGRRSSSPDLPCDPSHRQTGPRPPPRALKARSKMWLSTEYHLSSDRNACKVPAGRLQVRRWSEISSPG